jgi:DNA-damage-inducible protein D
MSDPLPAPAASNTFERIKRVNEAGAECWSSRDFSRILGYTDYRNFEAVIEKARTACLNSGQRVEDHFVEITEMIGIGKGGQRPVKTVLVSRYAGYLVIQNADLTKAIVALGQTYFATQTRRQELADDRALQEDQKRLLLRAEMKRHNKNLADVAKQAGVVLPWITPFSWITGIAARALWRIDQARHSCAQTVQTQGAHS